MESKHQFIEDLDGVFHSIFRAAGIAIDHNGLDAVREASRKLAATLEQRAHEVAVEAIKELQVRTGGAFEAIEDDLDLFEERIANLELKREEL